MPAVRAPRLPDPTHPCYAAHPPMAELNIRLLIDPDTGKKNLIIEYESDSDMLPIEHEEEHRRLINELVDGGVVKAEELGKVVVKRVLPNPSPAEQIEDEQPDERESIEQGS
jgi:hypothetical protein